MHRPHHDAGEDGDGADNGGDGPGGARRRLVAGGSRRVVTTPGSRSSGSIRDVSDRCARAPEPPPVAAVGSVARDVTPAALADMLLTGDLTAAASVRVAARVDESSTAGTARMEIAAAERGADVPSP